MKIYTNELLPAIKLDTGPSPTHAIIWMHGLGADGNDFVPIVNELKLESNIHIRFIFPHAPLRPVSINNGLVMRAWYDITSPNMSYSEDGLGIRSSQKEIDKLIEEEIRLGIASDHIFVAGFSQGGAMALQVGLRQARKLAGIMALSCYLPLAKTLETEANPINSSIPILMVHGTHDPVISLSQAMTSRKILIAAHYPLEWHEYPMQHAVCREEILDINKWLKNVLS